MRMKTWFAVALLALTTVTVVAQDKKKTNPMPADEKAAMDAMMKAMTPGSAHKLLDPVVGKFDAKVTSWMKPGAPPMVSSGTMESKWILGDRYVEERFTSSFMDMPFEGIGYNGYDNVKKQYWSTWIDNMSTGVMTSSGVTKDHGKNWTYTGSVSDPVSGKQVPSESRLIVTDADHHLMEMWGPGPDGKMFKMMEIAYTRKK